MFMLLSRHQIGSLIATIIDFGVLVTCVEYLKIWYVLATVYGAFAGGVSNFILNHYWVFSGDSIPVLLKIKRYSFILVCSLLMNAAGVFLLTNFGHNSYIYSKIISAIIIGVCFNFQMHRYYVFK